MNQSNEQILKPSQKKQLEPLQKKRIDALFIQQCIIRRFKHNHSADYDALLTMRNDIESILCDAGLNAVAKNQFEVSSTEVAMAIMSFLENGKNRHLLTNESASIIRERLSKHLSLSQKSRLLIERYLHENEIQDIIHILEKNVKFYEYLKIKYNIFDYFSMFNMTAYIPFDKFYKFFRESTKDKTQHYPIADEVTREAKWLYAIDSALESSIYLLITNHCCNRHFYSTNVDIIDDVDNEIVINGIKSHNAIYLKVPIDQSPNNIDAAIEYYKKAIIEQLINHLGCLANCQDKGFLDSKFLKFISNESYFVTQWNSIENNIIGLWCWDLVKIDSKTEAEAIEIIAETVPYEAISIKKNYNRIEDILSVNRGSKKKTSLDHFVTGSDKIILGLRMNEMCVKV